MYIYLEIIFLLQNIHLKEPLNGPTISLQLHRPLTIIQLHRPLTIIQLHRPLTIIRVHFGTMSSSAAGTTDGRSGRAFQKALK